MLSILAFSTACHLLAALMPPGSGFYSWHVIVFLGRVDGVRIVIAECSVDYEGRLRAHLPRATRLLMVKNDGSVLIHSDGGSYKPLNWMSPPCSLLVADYDEIPDSTREDLDTDVQQLWTVQAAKSDDRLLIRVYEVIHEHAHDLGVDPGLIKDGVEADLQRLLAEQIETLGKGYSLVRREYPTAIGPVDIMARDSNGISIAVELKRVGDIDGVEQLTRYLDLLNRDPRLAPVKGVLLHKRSSPRHGLLPKIAVSAASLSITMRCAVSTTQQIGFSKPTFMHCRDLRDSKTQVFGKVKAGTTNNWLYRLLPY